MVKADNGNKTYKPFSQPLTFMAQKILTIVTLKKVAITFLFKVSKDLKNGFADTFENQKTN